MGDIIPWFTKVCYTSKRWLGMGFLNHQRRITRFLVGPAAIPPPPQPWSPNDFSLPISCLRKTRAHKGVIFSSQTSAFHDFQASEWLPMTDPSGQIIIFHQPRFPWNKGISRNLSYLFFWGENSCFRSRTNLTRSMDVYKNLHEWLMFMVNVDMDPMGSGLPSNLGNPRSEILSVWPKIWQKKQIHN